MPDCDQMLNYVPTSSGLVEVSGVAMTLISAMKPPKCCKILGPQPSVGTLSGRPYYGDSKPIASYQVLERRLDPGQLFTATPEESNFLSEFKRRDLMSGLG